MDRYSVKFTAGAVCPVHWADSLDHEAASEFAGTVKNDERVGKLLGAASAAELRLRRLRGSADAFGYVT